MFAFGEIYRYTLKEFVLVKFVKVKPGKFCTKFPKNIFTVRVREERNFGVPLGRKGEDFLPPITSRNYLYGQSNLSHESYINLFFISHFSSELILS